MRLTELVDRNVPVLGGDPVITGITADSRAVGPGMLFAAIPGTAHDGRSFIAAAADAGAVAVLAPRGTVVPSGLALVEADEPRGALARMAGRFYPRRPDVIAAVTGTNGKSSVVSFTRQIWMRLGLSAACLGTLGYEGPGDLSAPALTTADPVALHRLLDQAARAGVGHLALEASSHGIDQHRLDGIAPVAVAFTNLTHDHLDYHGTIEAYRDAKLQLFSRLAAPAGYAVVNADSRTYDQVVRAALKRPLAVIDYGRKARVLRLVSVESMPGGGLHVVIEHSGQRHEFGLGLIGSFQAHNVLAAVGLVIGCGGSLPAALATLSHLKAVPGRMEQVGMTADGAPVIVDYAHTPDALETVIKAVRPHADGRVVVVFGCGGDRDRAKRPLMGRIATREADHVIVTDDNPRSEDPAAIRAEIMAAAPDAVEIGDRAAAIEAAVAGLEPGDVLLIAGKGHETGQTIAGTVHPFSDRQQALAALARRGRVQADGGRP
ncbi:UDP-N-acetylmuramoyl-L-alanyl-D-glutamate--2,6-diaminopimelate ligase [Tistrella bauzanensis]|uniref:UDP-N-acetylmuramoyl-L-alanyl-D-glutamate--2,6-diaminopimelate ligase n=1 Tax=Tistrella bauzanensis TaxID=657419 RepID=A0ABQ1I922_9PROT|nr:UDP-N-acetylmuramoyl-L-alanyl-D-glutamate--2,6-diaminopimelate ligase [Tistrella bauzanensis]GGB23527.1 UDP-N-acetylmuramoyl-L-alanyl-D-glutamate--2,6-diaminopimelate ligase [Tistrella bauzanensis]